MDDEYDVVSDSATISAVAQGGGVEMHIHDYVVVLSAAQAREYAMALMKCAEVAEGREIGES